MAVAIEIDPFTIDFDPRFKIFHELMAKKVREILLVSTPYDAWVMEEDCRLSERIINEYRGLNLSRPPRFTWVSTAEEALAVLDRRNFDMVITMPQLADMDAFLLGREIKKKAANLPVILLSHSFIPSPAAGNREYFSGIDRIFVWSGNTDMLVALVKSTEDRMNAAGDTLAAGIRVILFVEDSPRDASSLLPILYRELVSQTQAVMEEGLNEEHRLLTMRARPKILMASTYEEAVALFDQYEPYVLGVISDIRFPRKNDIDDTAGIDFLSRVRAERFDIPLLLTSSRPQHSDKAAQIPASFACKHSPTLYKEVRSFFREHLGFGDFVFRNPDDGTSIARASNMRALERCLRDIPNSSFVFHSSRNDFSRWLFARTEIMLASKVRPISGDNFSDVRSHREFLISTIEARRRRRQKGVVTNFNASDFDLDTEFFKIGKGSLGGKARGLAFVSSLLRANHAFHKKFEAVNLLVPQTLVITTDGFESFIEANDLRHLSKADVTDEQIAQAFLAAEFPGWIEKDLRAYLTHVRYPLAIRSSSLLEDAQFRAYAGLYRTYMISNDHPDLEVRLGHLIHAVKLVYASTYFKGPKSFSKRVGHRTEEEQMAVIIQQLVGETYGESFYPAISGVAQSRNYYPFSHMRPEDGIATIAMGLGKIVVEGEKTLRFSPKYPQILPQRSTVTDVLDNSQRHFYSLKMEKDCHSLTINDSAHLERREISEADQETPFRLLASTYVPEEHRIRDTMLVDGHRVLTFSHVLKYRQFPLADILIDALQMGQAGMGCPVELEFSVNLCQTGKESVCNPEFAFLQLRPMTARAESLTVDITAEEIDKAFCFSTHALGNAENREMTDIIYVKPEAFDSARTMEIAGEIGKLNASLVQEERKYLLIGPGRWGSADRWLGIPVVWEDISGVGAMVETVSEKLKADPSQGSHFFHNITTLGINYITVRRHGEDVLDWEWLTAQSRISDLKFVVHIRLDNPITLKVDGSKSCGVMYV